VLESYYDRILKSDSKYVEAHIAVAELALEKADFQEAVTSLERALELRPDDPHIHYSLARAWEPSDSEKASKYLMSALELNPRHVESLLLHARNLIDSEQYEESEKRLEEVFDVNPSSPRGWALKAAIAHLRGEYLEEGKYRSEALEKWSTNPAVDFLIGQTLSKHYRFAEGVTYQRRALKLDPGYLPAKFQLAQDLLRVGEDDEGWSIVDQVAVADKYNVVAFNLKTLQERLAQFTTIEVPGFIIRMDTRESQIYGPRVIELLQEAKAVLCDKYEFELQQPTTVEIFPQQSDFAIRTFGLPGGAGYLGVCFGSLITANSPASQGEAPSNWESVLWHEFCHVVTLQKTNNRMPRWLSEGISVYEELERDPSWGQSMTPRYQQMILGEDFVPLSELSGAFLNPKSALHLQFAYFESSLAVRYLIEVHGLPLLLKLLEDLGLGVTMEDAFSRRYGDAEALDADFEKVCPSGGRGLHCRKPTSRRKACPRSPRPSIFVSG
jgi:tetratricopeptide (TPR) repeat protein